jgi:hypothetical protein
MRDAEKATLERKLHEFSDRLKARTVEFSRSGGFSDAHRAILRDIQQRNEKLRTKVKEAESDRSIWELIKAEVVRDFTALFDDLQKFEDNLDAEFSKANKESLHETSR